MSDWLDRWMDGWIWTPQEQVSTSLKPSNVWYTAKHRVGA